MVKLMVQELTPSHLVKYGKVTSRTICSKVMVMSSIRVREPRLSSKITKSTERSVRNLQIKVDSKPKLVGMKENLLTVKPVVTVLSVILQVNLRVTSTLVR